jgi:hypothetical protein
MGDIVDLSKRKLPTRDDFEFVSDLARFRENLLDEKSIRKKYRLLAESDWESLGNDDELIRAVEAESVRRVRDGSCKRERAQALITKAPGILDSIMSDASANARHRIDSAKTLNDFASNGPGDTAPAADRFIIQINMGADTLTFNKSIKPDADDVDPNEVVINTEPFGYPDPLPPDMVAAITARKKDGGGNGEPI